MKTDKIMRLDFNTGRTYSTEGQPMVAIYKPAEGLVRFADMARSMHGEFEWTGENDPQIIQEVVLHKYDRAEYQVNRMTRCFYQFEKKVWNTIQKEKNRSKASRQMIEQLIKLEHLADDIRAQFEEIANDFHLDQGPNLDPKHADDGTSYEMYQLACDVFSNATDLHQQISEFTAEIKEVTR